MAPSRNDVVVANKSVGGAHLDQAQVWQTQPGGHHLSNLGVDPLPHLDAAVSNVDGGVMLIDGDLKLLRTIKILPIIFTC